MKKIRSIFLMGFLLLLLVPGAQAVSWDALTPLYPTPAGNYSVPISLNGGWFTYGSSYDNFNYGSGASSNNSDLHSLNIPASANTTDNFGGNGGSINFQANAGGGVRPDGLYSAGHSSITHSALTNMNGVSSGLQHIVSDTFRNFIPDGYETIRVVADMAGNIDWEVYNYDWGTGTISDDWSPYSGYLLQGNVTVSAHSASQGGAQVGSIGSIGLDNGTLTGSLQFDPIADTDIFYILHVSLVIDTYIQNANPLWGAWYGDAGTIPDPLSIGTALDPLELTAVVTQTPVPVPASVLLLLSGVGSLVAFRRRVSGARKSS